MKISRAARYSYASFACLSFVALTAPAQSPRGITPEDNYAFEFISDPNMTLDGTLVAYVVTKIDRAQNRRNSASGGGHRRQVNGDVARASSPCDSRARHTSRSSAR